MNADKIKRLRDVGEMFDNASKSGEWELPKLFREASDELERLGKLEAAAKDFMRADTQLDSLEAFDRMAEALREKRTGREV